MLLSRVLPWNAMELMLKSDNGTGAQDGGGLAHLVLHRDNTKCLNTPITMFKSSSSTSEMLKLPRFSGLHPCCLSNHAYLVFCEYLPGESIPETNRLMICKSSQ